MKDRGKTDDDFLGFVFAYQNSTRFYVVSWKKHNRDLNGRAGVSIKVNLFCFVVCCVCLIVWY